ncbi:3-hydroxy-acyl-CoA-dehydrogenase [Mycena leptocephala]|nr:3-hydroxy-acyl-CoA-dehydrogenase [Mycena leptocephala]
MLFTFCHGYRSSGLGLATVHDLISANAYISIVDRSPPPADLPTSKIKFFETDITVLEQIEHAVDATIKWIAEQIIDAHNEPHPIDLWDFTIAVNLTGTFNLTRLALRHLDGPDGERGVFEGQPGQTAYSASKGALRSMTLPLARDLSRHAIRVVTVAPGVFESSMTANLPQKARRSLETEGIVYPRRFGQPPEFAQTIRWILECPYVNGETIRLSGGGRLPGKL